jgi:hypothetical protein
MQIYIELIEKGKKIDLQPNYVGNGNLIQDMGAYAPTTRKKYF